MDWKRKNFSVKYDPDKEYPVIKAFEPVYAFYKAFCKLFARLLLRFSEEITSYACKNIEEMTFMR